MCERPALSVPNPSTDITGLILAGGRGRRMGGRDKGLERLDGVTLVDHVRARLVGNVAELLISANRHLARYRGLADRVVTDTEGGFQGPLMGIYSGLCAAHTPWVLVVPCDTPMLPRDLVARMAAGIGGHRIAVAHDGERLHPVVALLERALAADLHAALVAGERKVGRWYERHAWTRVDFSDCPEAFGNLNTEEDRRRLETRLNEESRP
ncbi:molybdenum cofactor guanylyltransferase [Halomonas sp. MCCC 1A17488]|uniref:Molybdenum cofactor guanylyltransferase n=1 Tax=Billgrantia sulfidoxydans TaxID=2733484 RepID=A0ABX7W5I9_9GAMM|nr:MULTISPECIES: molybdenum cofactor guanylyltransferase MobA [Halomonas]MCE8015358.1 molybdenum cofactor guanylyltransferase [Halomonas sp. MCCC 1A17488]MCG3238691.1 molybdenum cofactor guanylyltransferase [Halomonas sp. MCCC 1A17488]QPP51337.1 molybdenum cofactor guanylyltransferase [Halomonas sp. SS10-MC5]QTP54892.1 molybdenum cofactor guanylyltransferase [Halomonas sulfidoxydans]